MCPFNEKYLHQAIANDKYSDSLNEALHKFDEGYPEIGHEICDKLGIKSSLAIVVSSLFSKDHENEIEFEKRHILDLTKAAEQKNSLALYSIAVYYDQGTILEESKSKAQDYYCRAAKAGSDLAKHVYGIMLYYGTDTLKPNKEEGIKLLLSSASNGVDDARVFLSSIGITTAG
ncbi:tetratricopeptide repeat protein [Candidatus Thiodiazotropha sp. LNASS1]|uniref:tetratricopeptide repeat protein n=1 Tax=Candidatus Thiodiazotropha sp. LNASS1 TaxID=3096260 RepID=UPI0034E04CB8